MTARRVLRIADDFALPLEAVTETVAILGIRGSGKTNTATVIAEELLERGQQVVVIDPTDVWWGLKSSADGEGPGYPVVVLGGKREDLPLGAGDGATVADFVVDEGVSVVCSLRKFESKKQQRAFVTDFARRLYYRKGQQEHPAPTMVMFDEASLFVPQRVMGEDAQMVGAIQQLVRQGRSSGFGVTLIDQRASTVNKDVLTQLELLVAHRTSSPQDRKALEAWIEQHDSDGHHDEFMEALAALPRGTAWVWSPGWLEVFRQVAVRARRTFDSSYTPKAGERAITPKKVAQVDLAAIRGKLAQSIETARANDPRELKKQIAELQQLLRAKEKERQPKGPSAEDLAAAKQAGREEAMHDLKKIIEPDLRTLRRLVAATAKRVQEAQADADALAEGASPVFAMLLGETEPPWHAPAPKRTPAPSPQPAARRTNAPARVTHAVSDETPAAAIGGITQPQQKIINTMIELEQLGIREPSRVQVAMLRGVSHTTGTFKQDVRELIAAGMVEVRAGSRLALTSQGRNWGNPGADAPQNLGALQSRWYQALPRPRAEMLRVIADAYPGAIAREELAAALGKSHTTGTFKDDLRKLRDYELVEFAGGGTVVATTTFFPEGLS